MAWQLIGAVLNDAPPDLAARPLRVLMCLAFHAPARSRQCAPGMEAIRREAGGVSKRTAERALRTLEARGLIKVVSAAAPGRKTVFEVLLEPLTGDDMMTPVTGDSIVTPVGENGRQHDDARTGDNMVTPVNSERVTDSGRTGDNMVTPYGRQHGDAPNEERRTNDFARGPARSHASRRADPPSWPERRGVLNPVNGVPPRREIPADETERGLAAMRAARADLASRPHPEREPVRRGDLNPHGLAGPALANWQVAELGRVGGRKPTPVPEPDPETTDDEPDDEIPY
jgi:hypothetical protein